MELGRSVQGSEASRPPCSFRSLEERSAPWCLASGRAVLLGSVPMPTPYAERLPVGGYGGSGLALPSSSAMRTACKWVHHGQTPAERQLQTLKLSS